MANYTVNVTANPDLIEIIQRLNPWLWALIVLVGLVGNIFSVWVIWTSKLRRVPSNHYLIALALSDSLFLVGLFIIWLDRIGPKVYHIDFTCKLVVFMLNMASWMSTWFVVALTVERYIVIHWPLHRVAICSVGMARRIILCIIPVPTVINLTTVLLTMGIEDQSCTVFDDYFLSATIINVIDTMATLIIPTLAITGFNLALTRSLIRTSSGSGTSSDRSFALQHVRRSTLQNVQNKEHKVTKTLLIISTVFVVLNLPSYVIRMKNFVLVHFSSSERSTQIVVTDGDVVSEFLGTILYYSTFAVNFFVYSASSKNFRKSAFIALSKRLNSIDFIKRLFGAKLETKPSVSFAASTTNGYCNGGHGTKISQLKTTTTTNNCSKKRHNSLAYETRELLWRGGDAMPDFALKKRLSADLLIQIQNCHVTPPASAAETGDRTGDYSPELGLISPGFKLREIQNVFHL